MANIIKVDIGTMIDTTAKFKNCQQQLKNAYLTMSNAVREVDSIWNGEASETFKSQFDSMYKNLEQTEAKVKDAIDEVTKAAEIYEEVEKLVAQMAGALDIGTSPFN